MAILAPSEVLEMAQRLGVRDYEGSYHRLGGGVARKSAAALRRLIEQELQGSAAGTCDAQILAAYEKGIGAPPKDPLAQPDYRDRYRRR